MGKLTAERQWECWARLKGNEKEYKITLKKDKIQKDTNIRRSQMSVSNAMNTLQNNEIQN